MIRFAKYYNEANFENDVRIAYLNAQLSLFDVKFSGKGFPKSADDLLNKNKPPKVYTDDQWRGLVKALEAKFGSEPSKKKKKGK